MSRLRRMRSWLLSPPGLATLVTALFIVISVVWVLYDERVPDWDMGRHLGNIFTLREQVLNGAPFAWWHFETGTLYPPVAYVVGITGTLIGGVNVDAPVVALNLVGVPLLAVGCYRAASIAYDRRAGVLAVLFALGGPMAISQFHVFMIDMTQAGFVAASVWLLMESERFSRPGMSILAGLLTGAALLTKQSSAFFLAPLVAVMLLRGGLRDWREATQTNMALPLLRTPVCALLFAGVALLMALPWYLEHSQRLNEVAASAGVADSSRLTFDNFSWYAWNLINNQLFLPFAVFLAIGIVHATVHWLRSRSHTDYGPELIVGALGSYFIATLWFGFHDARYTIPALVYLAVLATGWIARVGRPIQLTAGAALVAVFAVNTVAINLGFPGPVRVPIGLEANKRISNTVIPEEQSGTTTILRDQGHIVGPPHKGGEVLELMRAAAKDGVEAVGYEESGVHLHPSGVGVLTRLAPMYLHNTYSGPSPILRQYRAGEYNPVLFGKRVIYLIHWPPGSPGPEPCGHMADGGGLYVFRGAPGEIDDAGQLIEPQFQNLYCPL